MGNDVELDFLEGGGEMGALMRRFDWSTTAVGMPGTWPQSLRTVVRLLLNTGHPMYIFWGPAGTCMYNDAYSKSLGPEMHPMSLGGSARQVWDEIWDVIGPQVEQVMAGQGATWHENHLVPITRNGARENVYWTYSFGPIDDKSAPSGVGGVLVVCTETTATVDNARRLAESEARLQMALSAGRGIGTWDWDVVNDRVFADERFARLYGVAPELAHTGAPVAEFFKAIHPDDLARVKQQIDVSLHSGATLSTEYRLLSADGIERWVIAEGRCEFSADGTPLRFPGASFDITARKITEQRLEELNADLERKIAEQARERSRTWQVSPDLLGALNSKGYFVTSNPAWQVVLGWSEAEVASMSIFELLHPEDVERTRIGFNLTQQGQPAIGFPSRYRRKDGSYRWISWVGVPEDGLVYCSGRDITEERRQADLLAMRTSERDSAWAVSQDLFVVSELSGTLISLNAAWTRLLGWNDSELIGRPFHDFMHPEDLQATLAVFQTIAQRPLSVPYEYRLRHKDGSYRWLAWTAAFENGVIHAVGRDITLAREKEMRLRETEEALRQSQKMEAVGQLTGGVAHDFNNLLATMSASLQVLKMRLGQGLLEGHERYIGMGVDAVRRAAALTQRLLAFSRRQSLDPKSTNAYRLIIEMEELIRRTVGPGIQVEVAEVTKAAEADGLWTTRVDRNQLENALLNLSINARDAMPDGGYLTIETSNQWLDQSAASEHDLPPGQYIALSVSDNGSGMPDDVIAKAFDPFFTTKPLGAGTGLGLSMVYGFARQSGGQVRIDSEIGKGTTVTLYLPRHDQAHEILVNAAASSASGYDGAGKVVLIIDDEITIRQLIREVLETSGYAAIEAADGPAGLRILQSNAKIDLLITDVGLPGGMNGRQVADAARIVRPQLKVLFVTGYAENAALGDGSLEHGMAVVTKPFAMDDLAQKIGAMLGTHFEVDPIVSAAP